jgi:hypothetical protein
MFRPQQPVPNPDLPPESPKMFSCADLSVLCVSAFSSLSRFTLSFFRNKRENITPLYSRPSALFKNECSDKSFPVNSFRTLVQNTGGGTPPPEILAFFSGVLASAQSPSATKSRGIRIYEKCVHNPSIIRTSKTQHLKPFRICTYEKTGGRGPQPILFPLRPKRARNIQLLPLTAFHLGNALTRMEV